MAKTSCSVHERADLLLQLADQIDALAPPHPVRVAIDGIDAAGKTTLANELAEHLTDRGRAVIRASVDGFLHPRVHRYRLGRDSAEGYFRDCFDLERLDEQLLSPLGPGGDRRYRAQVFDHPSDRPAPAEVRRAEPNAVLLFDGVFLLRPELRGHFDYAIFVDVSLPTSLERGIARDLRPEQSEEDLRDLWETRYQQAQLLYLRECSPLSWVDAVVFNEDVHQPRLQLCKPPAGRGQSGRL